MSQSRRKQGNRGRMPTAILPLYIPSGDRNFPGTTLVALDVAADGATRRAPWQPRPRERERLPRSNVSRARAPRAVFHIGIVSKDIPPEPLPAEYIDG